MRKQLPFTPAVPVKQPDNLYTSYALQLGMRGFTPSYLKKKENMCYLMSNEYMRMWLKDLEDYNNELNITTPKVHVETRILRRRHVQNVLKRQIPQKNLPIITLKRFQHLPNAPKQVENKGTRRQRYVVEYDSEEIAGETPSEMDAVAINKDYQRSTHEGSALNENKKAANSYKIDCKIFCQNPTEKLYE